MISKDNNLAELVVARMFGSFRYWRLVFFILSLFCLSTKSAAVTHNDFRRDDIPVSTKRSDDRGEHYNIPTTGNYDRPGTSVSLSSTTKEDSSDDTTTTISNSNSNSNSNNNKNMAIRSNQYGLLSISILVEDEESTTTNREMNDHIGKDKQRCDECGMNEGDYHGKNNNIVWTVSVVEITVSSNNDEPSSSSSSYLQRVLLRWNKTKEVEEDPIDNSDVGSIAPQSLRERTIHWSGIANCTFIIPLERYDTSSSSSSSSSSISSSYATRTFIVSLMKTCGTMATMSNISPYKRSQYEDDIRSDENATKTLLTRRLATLPRRAHSRPTIDPVAKVFLNYRQQRRCGDLYQSPPFVLHSDGMDSRRENTGKNNNDDDDNDSHDYFRGYIDVFVF
jgi:hypothetical protein